MMNNRMSVKKLSLTVFTLMVLVSLVLVGVIGMLVGRAQSPQKPTVIPPLDVSTPTPVLEPLPGTASISGFVWHDLCAVAGGKGGIPLTPSAGCILTEDGVYRVNGQPELDEPGIGGVLIQLGSGACPASGLEIATTDTSGMYTFSRLKAGTYCVSVDVSGPRNASLLPGNWTSPLLGVDGNVTGRTIVLLEGERRPGVSFGWDYQFLPEPEPVPTPEPEPTAAPEPPPSPNSCTDKVSFVGDVTIPDNTYLSPGQSFVKTWRLRNSGDCTWTTDYALAFVGGHKMGGTASVPLRGPVAPGGTVDLSVNLTAPAGNGTYEGKWQLQNADGVLFGTGDKADGFFWVRIVVGPTPTPAPTFGGWRGEYHDIRKVSNVPLLVRDDAEINFDWRKAAPAVGVPADGFFVRWTRTLSFASGTYRFYAHSDDGVRVWLDGQLIINEWHEASGTTYSVVRTLTADQHTLRVEYYENTGDAYIQFWWGRVADSSQWWGEYFPNTGLTGAPKLTRGDLAIDFTWGNNAPAVGLPADGFSARWTRSQTFEEGLYRFHVVIDDGARLWVDNTMVLDAWQDGGRREVTADYRLSAGNHNLRVEYYERVGEALIQVWWEKLSSYPDWRGEYWSNRNLSGSPLLVRNDTVLDFNWGRGAPAAGLPVDDFSVRWTRTAEFDAATYRFYILVDDGARLWVDDQKIIDSWRDGAARELTAEYALTRGTHRLRVEYYEHTGDAQVRVWWKKVSSPSYPDWKGEYWSNQSLNGNPKLVRNDKAIDFQWGDGAAASGLPADDFSVRWSRKVSFNPPGVYRLHVLADDGIRVYVDGDMVLNEWHASKGDEVYVTDLTLRDEHQVVVEYYERGGKAKARFWWKRVGDWPTPPPPNRPPVAVDDVATTNEDTPVNVNVLANDSDPDGDVLTVNDYSDSQRGGTVKCAGAEACTYTPPANFDGTDTFAYVVSDGKGGSDTGVVTIVVHPVNDPPVAVNDSATTDEDVAVNINVLANDSDRDRDVLSVSDYHKTSTKGGAVSCTGAGVCTYTPLANFNGTDTFGYTVSDGKGGNASATVTIVVNPVNDPPVAVDDSATTDANGPVNINVLANDTDPDGDALTVSDYSATSVQSSTVECTSLGVCTYTPPPNFGGTDTFTYTVSDGKGGVSSAVVTVMVEPANRSPAPEAGQIGQPRTTTIKSRYLGGYVQR
jgi:hypothetical protein